MKSPFQNPPAQAEQWLTARELATRFFLDADSVHRWRRQGRIPKQFVRARGKRMEFSPDLIAYLTEHFEMCHKPPACKERPPMSKPSGPFLVKEVAAELCLTQQAVINLIEEGKLSAINVGGRGRKFWRVPREALEDFKRKRNSMTNPP